MAIMEEGRGEKESSRLKNLFDKLDLNKDGKIDSEELAEGLYNMGYVHIRYVKHSDQHCSNILLSVNNRFKCSYKDQT